MDYAGLLAERARLDAEIKKRREEEAPPVARAICEARKARGMSKSELARRCDVSFTAVLHWETGARSPRPAYRRRLETALGVTLPETGRAAA